MSERTPSPPPPPLPSRMMGLDWQGEPASAWPPNVQAAARKPSPASALLGLTVEAVSKRDGKVRLRFEAGAQLCNKWGAIQGGMVAAMLDDAMAFAVGLNLDWGQISPTLELKVSMLAPVRPGKIYAHGWVVRRGRTIGFVAGALTDGEGALLATGSSTASFVTLNRKPARAKNQSAKPA